MGFTANITEMSWCGFQLGWDRDPRSTSLTFVTSVFIHPLCLQVGFSQGRNMDVTNNWGHSSSLTSKNEREGILSHNNLKMSRAFHRSKYHCTSSCGQGNTGWLRSMLLEITPYGQISQHSPVEFGMDCYQITLVHIRERGKKDVGERTRQSTMCICHSWNFCYKNPKLHDITKRLFITQYRSSMIKCARSIAGYYN